jgi:acyl-coenzyme A thioesterase PaaI-like protein
MTPNSAAIDTLRKAYAHCFGCGLDNPSGLRLDGFIVQDRTVRAPFAPQPAFAGFDGVLHGGIVAAALDEISAWSAMLTEGVLVFTAKLEIRYRRQADANGMFTLAGEVTERRGKRLSITASMRSGDETIASSEGLFVAAKAVDPID